MPISLLGDPYLAVGGRGGARGASSNDFICTCIHLHVPDVPTYELLASTIRVATNLQNLLGTHQPPFATVSFLPFNRAPFHLLQHHDTCSPRLSSCFTTIAFLWTEFMMAGAQRCTICQFAISEEDIIEGLLRHFVLGSHKADLVTTRSRRNQIRRSDMLFP